MRKTKKLSALTIAACMSVGLAVPLNLEVSAEVNSNLLGDINGDGKIDTLDLVILQNYLYGKCEITRHGFADIDYDGVITMSDLSILSKYIAGVSELPTNVNDITVSEMDRSRSYIMYNYKTKRSSGYNLKKSDIDSFSAENQISPQEFNVDDRERTNDTAVVQIDSSGGTGFIVDNHIIATAAHCVYDDSTGFGKDVTVDIYEDNDSGKHKSVKAAEVHIPRDYVNLVNETGTHLRSMFDYALIYVEEDLSEYGKFDLGIPSDEFMDSKTTVTVSGFPQVVHGSFDDANCEYLYKADGVILNCHSYAGENNWQFKGHPQKQENFFSHQLMTSAYGSGGDSGGPIYMTINVGSNEYHTVVGIYTSVGLNDVDYDGNDEQVSFGVRMTSSLLRFYYNNDYINSSLN